MGKKKTDSESKTQNLEKIIEDIAYYYESSSKSISKINKISTVKRNSNRLKVRDSSSTKTSMEELKSKNMRVTQNG